MGAPQDSQVRRPVNLAQEEWGGEKAALVWRRCVRSLAWTAWLLSYVPCGKKCRSSGESVKLYYPLKRCHFLYDTGFKQLLFLNIKSVNCWLTTRLPLIYLSLLVSHNTSSEKANLDQVFSISFGDHSTHHCKPGKEGKKLYKPGSPVLRKAASFAPNSSQFCYSSAMLFLSNWKVERTKGLRVWLAPWRRSGVMLKWI